MNKLIYNNGYYIFKDYSENVKCTPTIFFKENLSFLKDINGYSYCDTKEFINGLRNLMNGGKIWNGDDYDYHWSGGEVIVFTSNEQSTVIRDVFKDSSLEVSTLEVYDLLLNRLRLMEDYPINLIRKMILNSIEKTQDVNWFSEVHIEIRINKDDIKSIGANAESVIFEEKYFPINNSI